MADPVWKTLGFDSEDDYTLWVNRNMHLDELRSAAAVERQKKIDAENEEKKKKKKKSIFD